jgi:hypothetical protein
MLNRLLNHLALSCMLCNCAAMFLFFAIESVTTGENLMWSLAFGFYLRIWYTVTFKLNPNVKRRDN